MQIQGDLITKNTPMASICKCQILVFSVLYLNSQSLQVSYRSYFVNTSYFPRVKVDYFGSKIESFLLNFYSDKSMKASDRLIDVEG